jgi:hypothetical protein
MKAFLCRFSTAGQELVQRYLRPNGTANARKAILASSLRKSRHGVSFALEATWTSLGQSRI